MIHSDNLTASDTSVPLPLLRTGAITRYMHSVVTASNFRKSTLHATTIATARINFQHTMNFFRLAADLSHMASHLILLYSIYRNKSINGLSLKTQILYVVVFVFRYLDVFTSFISAYNTFMKVFFVGTSAYTVYLMSYKYQKTIRENLDTFPVKYLVAPSALLSFIFTHAYTIREVTWSFSIWLESVAIIPQLYMLQRTGSAENITTHYIFALGIYRALYIPNWIYRYFFENKFDYIAVLAGVLQTIVYSDFFYIYYTKVMQGKSFELPV